MKAAALFAALAIAACSSGPPQPSLGARMADMIAQDQDDCAHNLPGACMRYQFNSQAVLQFLAPPPPSAYSLTVNRGFGW